MYIQSKRDHLRPFARHGPCVSSPPSALIEGINTKAKNRIEDSPLTPKEAEKAKTRVQKAAAKVNTGLYLHSESYSKIM